MEKIQVNFNQVQFEKSVKSLQENVIKYITYLDAVNHITDSREFKTLKEIEQIIKDKSGFSNIILSAGLLECLDAYKFIESNHSAINTDVLEFDADGTPTTKQSVLDQVKEDCTTYLKEEFIPDYKILLSACDALNTLSNVNAVNFLNRTYDGIYSVNLQQFNNSHRM